MIKKKLYKINIMKSILFLKNVFMRQEMILIIII